MYYIGTSFIRSNLEYAPIIWENNSIGHSDQLEKIQTKSFGSYALNMLYQEPPPPPPTPSPPPPAAVPFFFFLTFRYHFSFLAALCFIFYVRYRFPESAAVAAKVGPFISRRILYIIYLSACIRALIPAKRPSSSL